MAIGSKRNFTITDLNKRTIVLRRCSPGGALGSMRLTPVYSDSYSLGLAYGSGAAAWYTSNASGSEPTIVDLATARDADPPLNINTLTGINVDRIRGVPEDGLVQASIGFNGSFEIQAGSPLKRPKVVKVELKTRVAGGFVAEYLYSTGSSSTFVLSDTVSIWGIELDKGSPVQPLTVSGVQDPDDPLKTRYTIPFNVSSTPEWAAGGQPRAYQYKLGDFMEGIIRLRAPGAGGITPSPVCGTSIE
jgi:hypothetical protein